MHNENPGPQYIDLSIPNLRATFLSVALTLPLMGIFLGLYLLFYGAGELPMVIEMVSDHPYLSTGILAAAIILHELIHAAAWVFVGGIPWRDIQFGFQLRTITPYVHCPEPMNARDYRIGGMLPLLLQGILPAFLALIVESEMLLMFGLFFILVAGGDLLILWKLRGFGPRSIVVDHPSQAGCYVKKQQA